MPIYDPRIKVNVNRSDEEIKKATNTAINHFYERLLLLKDSMNTKTGKKIAEKRHKFMLEYLDRFFEEWNLK